MDDATIRDYKTRVDGMLGAFRDQYGLEADLVNISNQTTCTETYKIMKVILAEKNIAVKIDDRVAAGKFMFTNRELAASNLL